MFRILKDLLTGKNVKEQKHETNKKQLSKSLEENISIFKEIFDNDNTIIFRNLETQKPDSINCSLIFVDGMIDKEIVNENILLPIMNNTISKDIDNSNLLDFLIKKIIISDDIKKSTDIDEIVGSIVYGDTILIVDGLDEVLILNTKGWSFRSINEPSSELVVRGPREGFIESILVNTSLIRRKIRNSGLKFEFKEIGARTKTKVSLCYVDNLVNKKVLEELKSRLDKIDIDSILESNYIEELICDSPFSPFETIGYTERPDVVAGKLLEGRVAILVDGTPVVLTVPFLFIEYFQSNQDYYNFYFFASFNRLLRYIAFFFTTSIPAIYLSLVTFHQEMLPTPLLLSISSARDSVPFPTILEILIMLLIFDILREGGIRLPEPVGAAISIVGALVIGEAAVAAKIVSAPIVIVISLTGISAFLIYQMKGGIIFARFILLFFSSFLGLYGYMFGIIGLFIHLMSMRSFGIPYMLNVGALNKQDVKDTTVRAPWWYMDYRPKLISKVDSIRESNTANKKDKDNS